MIRFITLTIAFLLASAAWAVEKEPTEAQQLRDKAVALFNQEQYPQALELFIRGIEVAERDGDDDTYMICTGYVSNIYDAFGDYKSGLAYMHKGYDMAVKLDNKAIQSNFLNNMVIGYCRMGDVENAKRTYALSLRLPLQPNMPYWEYYIRYNKANILRTEGKMQEAIDAHHEALEYARRHDFVGGETKRGMFMLYQESEIGNIYARTGQADSALHYGYLCLAHARRLNSPELAANACKMLGDAYRLTNQTDSANKYMSMYAETSDSVYDVKKFYTAKSRLAEYEDQITQRRISHLWRTIFIITGVLLCIAVLLFAVFVYNRRLREAQRLLISKNDELTRQDEMNKQLLRQYLQASPSPTPATDEPEEIVNEPTPQQTAAQAALLERVITVMGDLQAIADPDFSLQRLAELTESNTKYVSAVINDTYKKNFKTLLNEYRCREAARLLLDREQWAHLTMQAVYERVGYTNSTSFIRAFKNTFGMTPSTYQKLSSSTEKAE